ncbi:D-alanyl-D-alanine carboxypeptidase family protein [Alicyclobacillus tolerans]|uniref:serine-type D-Ala-D-Ala carboxypeptidase n=1 Tax=Alicyclobacillus tolerans TaxID=90970 RepID=A0ABT9LWZ4_9BACL|nr:D-alanyl-D-alanine carboxypeptidase family protein [Alicyclobacillus tengchongensis]MDP9728691.1 D-alanyl-D-alanine carboxypeptidase (penicillin-binding protein 5/6) [Alicyclobacillus tengchongensis]
MSEKKQQLSGVKKLAVFSCLVLPIFSFVEPPLIQASSLSQSASTYHVQKEKSSSNDDHQEIQLAAHARSAVLMEASTGKILFAKDEHERLPMASITKIMTMLLIMEAIDNGKLKLTDKVKASEYAASMGGSQIFLEPGEEMTVSDMLKGIAMASANDACVAMAEHLCGTSDAFVQKMNERASQLGMKDTHFVNCNGLPAENHYSSAYDIALMSRALLNHPEITKWTSVYSDYLRKDSAKPLWLVNTNKLVKFYEGMDGLKTGYTAEAKYCLSATAKKQGLRMIAVVMGEPKTTIRNAEVTAMMNWGFSQYEYKALHAAGSTITQVDVKGGKEKKINVMVSRAVGLVTEKGKRPDIDEKIIIQPLQAPIKKGQKVGELVVEENDHVVDKVALVAATSVEKASLSYRLGRSLRAFFSFGQS